MAEDNNKSEEVKFSQDQYDMLKRCSDAKDMTEWNERRKKKPEEDILLEGADLERAYLDGANLQGANLQEAKLRGANLQEAKLYKAKLQKAKLELANLQEANLGHANLQKAKLEKADLQKARLFGADLQEAQLEDANLQEADLRDANLQGACLFGANLQETNLECADLQKAWLWKANLQKAKLKGANLQEANLWEANLQEAYLWKANLQEAHLAEANLQEAFLAKANLQEAILEKADLQKAKLERANLQKANLWGANLQEANLEEANLKAAKFNKAKLQKADFTAAIVDGETLIWGCEIDKGTNFSGVGLDAIRIQPGAKQLLEYNIRHRSWEKWYKKHKYSQWPVKWFWGLSDYGISTGRVLKWFMLFALIFAMIYYVWGCVDVYGLGIEDRPGVVSNLFVLEKEHTNEAVAWNQVPVRSIYFSVITMTTLGFGDMYANAATKNDDPYAQARSGWGHVLLMIQVLLGYVMLGALVTRFAVLFTAGGPAGEFSEENE